MLPVIAGLAPALLLICYIYYADHLQREPMRQLWRAFCFGIGSIAVSLIFSTFLELFGLDNGYLGGLLGVLNQAFWGAAIPEETAKLLMLWLVVRRNPYFDERMDGIVYAVCVGMGFAGLENVMYLGESDDWVTLGIMRGLLAVPCHYYNAVAMGYFYSLYKWGQQERRTRNLVLAWVVPIMMHGIYDSLVMAVSVTDSVGLTCVLFVALIYTCTKCYKWARKRISQHIESDGRDRISNQEEKTEVE